MDFAFSPEQEALRSAAREFLADRYPLDRVVAIADSESGLDRQAWRELTELGWFDDDLGVLEHAVLAEETGYGLLPAPYLSTVALARPAFEAAGRPVDGPATLAFAEADGPLLLRDAGLGRTSADGKGQVTGRKVLVPDATSAAVVVAPARGPEGPGLYAVNARDASIVARSTMDRTRRLGEIVLDGTPGELLVGPDRFDEVLARTRLRALALLSCEAVGVGQRALDISASYVKERQQFGRIIGTYQGVSHRIANIYVAVQLARSLAYWAAWAVSEDDEQAAQACAAAKSAAGEAAVFACENAIQCMGGIGFTWEHPLHRFYKRAQWIDAFEGFGRVHRADLAARLLDVA